MANYFVSTSTGDDNDSGTILYPWKTIAKANATMVAGDTTYIRGGTYAETIAPAGSGSNGNRIVYSSYEAELGKITASDGADINGKSYITINGVTFWKNVDQFFKIRNNASHTEIKNCIVDGDLTGGSVPYYCSEISNSTYTHVHHCTFQNPYRSTTEDVDEKIFLGFSSGGNYSLIEENIFKDGPGHSQVELYGGNHYNVIRNNEFVLTGLYTANNQEAVDHCVCLIRNNHYNIIEGNVAYATNGNIGQGNLHAITLNVGTQHAIVRNNTIYDIDRTGITLSTKEYKDSEYNAIYNNTFSNIGDDAKSTEALIQIASQASGSKVRHNTFCNNIFYDFAVRGNVILDPVTVGVDAYDNVFKNNIVFGTGAGVDVTKGKVINYSLVDPVNYTITEAETTFPTEFFDNIDSDPLFTDVNNKDFTLTALSPARNAGCHLTTVTSATGSGTSFVVDRPDFFTDGYGIVSGDFILVGSNDTVEITNVDYATKTITVASSISWINGDVIYLSDTGTSPDIGASQSAASDPPVGPTKPSSESLLMAYLFDGQGDEIHDSTEHCNHGSGINIVRGRDGIDLAGINERIVIPNFIGQDDDWSIFLKFIQDVRNPSGQSISSVFTSMQSGTGAGKSFLYIYDKGAAPTNKLGCWIDGADHNANTIINTGVAYTAGLTQGGTSFNFYLDGENDGSFTATATPANGDIILFDHEAAIGNGCFDGTVAVMYWFNQALTPEEMLWLHQNYDSMIESSYIPPEDPPEDTPGPPPANPPADNPNQSNAFRSFGQILRPNMITTARGRTLRSTAMGIMFRV